MIFTTQFFYFLQVLTVGAKDSFLSVTHLTTAIYEYPSSQPTGIPTLSTTEPTEAVESLPLTITESSVHSTSIDLIVRFDNINHFPGIIYCNALQSTFITNTTDFTPLVFEGVSIPYLAYSGDVNITITGLESLYSYYVFCGAQSSMGIRSSEYEIVNTTILINTPCCRTISFESTPSYLLVDSAYYLNLEHVGMNTFTFTLTSIPENDLIITPRLLSINDNMALTEFNVTIAPSQLLFVGNSTATQGSFSIFPINLIVNNTIQYRVELMIDGTDAWKYNSSSATTIVTFLSTTADPPVPAVSLVLFSDTGNGFYVHFDSFTNYGGIDSSQSYWSCSTLLSFDSDDTASCSWLNTTTIFVMLSSSSSLTFGASVSVKEGYIAAECISSTDCNNYESMSEVSRYIEAPLNPVSPYVILSVSSEFTSCSNVVMDASASSDSGGRPWTEIIWQVYNSDGVAVELVEQYLTTYHSNSYNLSNIVIPLELFEADDYYVTLTLSNFLGKTSSITETFRYGVDPNVPMVMIGGPTVVTMQASDSLSLYGTVTLSSCANSSKVSYDWIVEDITSISDVSEGGETLTDLKSSSKNPSMFVLSVKSLGWINTILHHPC